MSLDRIEDAIDDIREGRFVIVVDDEDRENEGDLCIAADLVTSEQVNFLLSHARASSAWPARASAGRPPTS